MFDDVRDRPRQVVLPSLQIDPTRSSAFALPSVSGERKNERCVKRWAQVGVALAAHHIRALIPPLGRNKATRRTSPLTTLCRHLRRPLWGRCSMSEHGRGGNFRSRPIADCAAGPAPSTRASYRRIGTAQSMLTHPPLRAALDALYAVLAAYSRPTKWEVASGRPTSLLQCLADTPLRELTYDALGSYSGWAMTTVGEPGHYKHFLPRIAELAVQGDCPYLGTSPPALADKIIYAGFARWPDLEQQAVRTVFRAAFEQAVTEHLTLPTLKNGFVLICALERTYPMRSKFGPLLHSPTPPCSWPRAYKAPSSAMAPPKRRPSGKSSLRCTVQPLMLGSSVQPREPI